MPIDWIFGLMGGLMIGTAAAMYLLISGRIMGASGIIGRLLDGTNRTAEPLAFVAGVILAPLILTIAAGGAPETNMTANPALLIAGGLAVGIGTRLANGCTSGHGVCGISRLSKRGIAATAIYLAAGFLTMAVLRHGLGWL
ncbi:YeeE/YedE family protein [Actibacterium sp. 188UL27-1]|uniref:YeeE/YedE family protein n=1 Tax=Actibacterium sp. 188UL27-1 TaxID=2786961 RepID=UPI00195C719E|nr:YeeE/YedE thiosulfate transporter family protein [Actibacterium sp. 188UL27-1]MBM7066243.1 YeeE/YedE family protein [Actibacterium sp. 188UL27-1]